MILDDDLEVAPSNSDSADPAGTMLPDLAAVAGAVPYKAPAAVEIPMFRLPSNYCRVKESAVPIFLAFAKKHNLFVHADTVVEYVEQRRGNGVLKPVTPAGLASRLESLGMLVKHVVGKDNKVVLKQSLCPKTSAEVLLEATEAREYLPPLAIVSNTPVLVSEMGVPKVLGAGYHAHLDGILVNCKSPPLDVPLAEAVDYLGGLLKDFRFETESDRARAMAMLLTIPMVDGGLLQGESVPLFVIEADQSQAGKGYLAKIVCAIVKQEPPPLSPRRGGVGGFDEDFDAALLRGHSCVLLDNIRGRIDSTHIESFFTADSEFLCRVPHRANLPVDARRYVILLTSNGFQTSPDLENRIIRIRLRKQPEEYDFHRYPEGHLLQRVRKHQHYSHGCVLAVLKYWMLQGFKTTRESRHDFRGWTRPLDWIIRHPFKDVICGRLLDEVHKATSLGSAENLGFQSPPATTPEP